MFSVIISEKGGAERRETFDRAEINVGRVQGNDLMLPKGNVSKRHARLLFRDGRFIVTDLKSTNGTYVNGRKIAQATIVREGDKIYIGDFVLRIEAGQGSSAAQVSPSQPAPPMEEMPSDIQSAPPGPIDDGRPSPPARPPALPAKPPPAPSSGGAPGIIPAPPPIPKQLSIDDGRHSSSAGPATMGPQASPDLAIPRPRAIPEAPRVPEIPRPPPIPASPSIPAPLSPEHPVVRASVAPGEPPSSSQPSSAAEKALRAPAPRIEPKTGDRHEIISHFPLEHDPDESLHFAVPAPPRVPSSAKPFSKTAQSAQLPPLPPVVAPSAPMAPPAPGGPSRAAIQPTAPGTPFHLPEKPAIQSGTAPLDRATSPSVGLAALGIIPGRPLEARPKSTAPADPGHRPPTGDFAPPVPVALPPPNPRAAVQRAALAALIEGVRERVDLSPLAGGAPPDDALADRVERALADAAGALRDEGDVDTLLVEARREICELGPLTSLLRDEDVSEIQVVRHDLVVGLRDGRAVPVDLGFSSEAAVGRVVRRLCLASGKPLGEGEAFVERRLAGAHGGARLFAVLPRVNDLGHVIVIRKPQRADLSLEDLVRSGTISRAMASLLSQCALARANVLVTGAAGAGTTTLLGALAGAGSTEDRVLVLQEEDELVFNQPHTVSILLGDRPEERVRAVQAAARIRPDRLVVGAFCGAAAAEMVDAMGSGANGVLAGARAPTLRQAVLRLTADIAASRPGLSPDVAREWLASGFDLAIEVARLRDGRHRVLRIAEPVLDAGKIALRDIFTFSVERTAAGGSLEGTFVPTGVVPAILDDLAARGYPVDPSIFRRHSRPDSSEGGSIQSPRLASADRSSSPGPDVSPLPRVR